MPSSSANVVNLKHPPKNNAWKPKEFMSGPNIRNPIVTNLTLHILLVLKLKLVRHISRQSNLDFKRYRK
jgi:hypothetical protein